MGANEPKAAVSNFSDGAAPLTDGATDTYLIFLSLLPFGQFVLATTCGQQTRAHVHID